MWNLTGHRYKIIAGLEYYMIVLHSLLEVKDRTSWIGEVRLTVNMEKGKNTQENDTYSDPPRWQWRWGRSTSCYHAKYQPPYPSWYTDLTSRCQRERHIQTCPKSGCAQASPSMLPIHYRMTGEAVRDWGGGRGKETPLSAMGSMELHCELSQHHLPVLPLN